MVRKLLPVSLFALGLMALNLGSAATADDKKDDLPDISTIMKKAHAKSSGYLARIGASAKAGKWEDAQKYAKDLIHAADALGRNKPPIGTPESWAALTKKYATNAKALADATEKKDPEAAKAALGKLSMSCGECHGPHKPKKKK